MLAKPDVAVVGKAWVVVAAGTAHLEYFHNKLVYIRYKNHSNTIFVTW